jgi:hypothetical protein
MTQSVKAGAGHLISSMAQLTVGAWLKLGSAPTPPSPFFHFLNTSHVHESLFAISRRYASSQFIRFMPSTPLASQGAIPLVWGNSDCFRIGTTDGDTCVAIGCTSV